MDNTTDHANQDDTVQELWNNGVSAQYLSEHLPERDAQQWELWLRNNRNQSRRASYRLAFERISNGTFYTPKELQKFVTREKSLRLGTIKLSKQALEVMQAYGVGAANGSTTGRALEVVRITQQVDITTGDLFVQFVTADPLMVYRLEPGQAKEIAEELLAASIDNSASRSSLPSHV